MANVPSLSVVETAALLDEVAASIKAEVPLSTSLSTLEVREAGRIGKVAASIKRSIDAGVPVEDAVAQHLQHYRGSIAAALRLGLATGNPARSLRALAKLMLQRREMRMRQLAAAIYPLSVILIGYFIGVFVFVEIIRLDSDFMQWPSVVKHGSEWLSSYWWLPPILFLFAAVAFQGMGLGRRLPSTLQPLRWSNQALFCDAVAWQLDGGVTLPDAIRAAAAMVDQKSLQADAETWALSIERGSWDQIRLHSFRPLIVWTLSTSVNPDAVPLVASRVVALKQLAESYRASEQHAWVFWTHWMPAILASIIGAGFSITYLCAVVWPLYNKLAEVH